MDGDLSVSVRLEITDAAWTLEDAPYGHRRLVLDIAITGEVTPGYRITSTTRDIATATVDAGTQAHDSWTTSSTLVERRP